MTRLCVAIFVTDLDKAKRDVATAAEAGADLVELRIDQFTDAEMVKSLLSAAILPCIVTCRAEWEGGHCALTEAERTKVLERAAESGAKYLDVELKAYQQAMEWRQRFHPELGTPREAAVDAENRPKLILSSHDFTGRPARLTNIFAEMEQTPADINKIVWTARSIRDNLEAFELLKLAHKPTIALCMGPAGLVSRILAKKFGGFLTFAALPGDAGTAPGQVSISDMKSVYQWDSINAATKVYGVVGSPIMHSMSPAIHNAGFDAVGHDGVYLPLLVEAGYESFKAFMEMFVAYEPLHLSGLSVTIPHKENALRYLKEKGAEVEELAERIGAVNTIVIERATASPLNPEPRTVNPRLRGFNTDYAAILDSITAKLNVTRGKLGDYRVAVIGAGGTGRTAVAALAHYGATVVVYNRTKERADELAAEFDGKSGKVVSARMEKLCDSCCHVFINTTSVGMYPKVDESPLGERVPGFTDETVVFDTIYNPMKTKLLGQAEAAGAKTISGVEMFVRQAAGQFAAWTGKEAPSDVMRRIVERRLARPLTG
jgi:3-dehydroquinate dehydratase/shikimate dehydrogenase